MPRVSCLRRSGFVLTLAFVAACGGRTVGGDGETVPEPLPGPPATPQFPTDAEPPSSPTHPPKDAGADSSAQAGSFPRGFVETRFTTDEDIGLFAVWAGSPSDAWAGGWPASYGGETPLLHWDGRRWSQVHPSGHAGTVIHGIWGSGAGDVWFAGETGSDGYVLHWDGTRAAEVFHTQGKLFCVGGTGPGDVWVAGENAAYHFDGATWTTQAFTNDTIYGMSMHRSTAWLAGDRGTYRRDTLWTAVDAPASFSVVAFGDAVWMGAANGGIYRRDGGAWSREATDLVYASTFWGTGPSDVWAVDAYDFDGKHYAHYDGTAWSTAIPGAPAGWVPKAVWGTRSDDVWFVGGSQIFHFGG